MSYLVRAAKRNMSCLVCAQISHVLLVLAAGGSNDAAAASLGPLDCIAANSRASSVDEHGLPILKLPGLEQPLPRRLTSKRNTRCLRWRNVLWPLDYIVHVGPNVLGECALLCLVRERDLDMRDDLIT